MNNEMYNHGLIPSEIAQHLKSICPEFGDLNVEEVLLMQESFFHYIENNKQKGILTSNSGETSTSNLGFTPENGSSHGTSVEHNLDLDEAFARALELGDDFSSLNVREHDVSAVEVMTSMLPADATDSTVRESSIRGETHSIRQDDIDPDRMTYEELQSLGESIGTESRGLPPDLISRLPTFKFKSGLLSRKKNKENQECVICCDKYKNGTRLTALPCVHQFHSRCITPWLQLNKQCPVCQKEVRDE